MEEKEPGCHPEREAADVGEECDAASRLRMLQREAAGPRLQREPDAEEPEGRDLTDEDEDQRQHTRAGEEDEVGAEDARNRAAGADVRDARTARAGELESDGGLRCHRHDAGYQVPEEEGDMPARVLDVVAEDPEEEHVAEDVLPA